MARIPYIDSEAMPHSLFNSFKDGPPPTRPNLYRALPNHPASAELLVETVKAISSRGKLDVRLRELVILRVAAHCNSAYEKHHHKRIGAQAGLTDEDMAAALREGGAGHLSAFEQAALAFTDAVVKDVKAPAALFLQMQSALGNELTVELVHLIGLYMMVARFLENFEVDIEAA
ncbi:MAG: carboxymuconolactone decarboxylase family protein [Comamonadaceae bacterium]|nr:MAG: carboxymuconolactone decarboxylase family protein [Comamonadaceae bacterium]